MKSNKLKDLLLTEETEDIFQFITEPESQFTDKHKTAFLENVRRQLNTCGHYSSTLVGKCHDCHRIHNRRYYYRHKDERLAYARTRSRSHATD